MPPDLLILLAAPLMHAKPAVIVPRRPSTLVWRRRVITELGALQLQQGRAIDQATG